MAIDLQQLFLSGATLERKYQHIVDTQANVQVETLTPATKKSVLESINDENPTTHFSSWDDLMKHENGVQMVTDLVDRVFSSQFRIKESWTDWTEILKELADNGEGRIVSNDPNKIATVVYDYIQKSNAEISGLKQINKNQWEKLFNEENLYIPKIRILNELESLATQHFRDRFQESFTSIKKTKNQLTELHAALSSNTLIQNTAPHTLVNKTAARKSSRPPPSTAPMPPSTPDDFHAGIVLQAIREENGVSIDELQASAYPNAKPNQNTIKNLETGLIQLDFAAVNKLTKALSMNEAERSLLISAKQLASDAKNKNGLRATNPEQYNQNKAKLLERLEHYKNTKSQIAETPTNIKGAAATTDANTPILDNDTPTTTTTITTTISNVIQQTPHRA